jgi:hypothetical protein
MKQYFTILKATAASAIFLMGCEGVAPNVIVEIPDDGKLGAGPDEVVDPSVPGPFAVGVTTFSDICIFDLERVAQLAGIDTQGVLGDGCGAENIDAERGHVLTNTFVTVFFNSVLRDSFPSRLLMRELLGQLDPAEAEAQVDLSFSVTP